MKRHIFFLILLTISFELYGQQPPLQEQVIRETHEQLALVCNELGRPVAQRNAQGQAPAFQPNAAQIQAKKLQLQGAPFNSLSNNIFEAREDGVRMMRLTQEALAQVTFATATAHESGLQECLIDKSAILDQERSRREQDEGRLETLQEIKQLQEQQRQRTADFQNACKDLKFLKEELGPLSQKMDQLMSNLCAQNQELTAAIIAAQEALRQLKYSTH